ncbi:hypothetical protein PSECIP111854_00443 [Pseudoalteromonas sp. CIP111854]|uniref:Uncharacterized protein n=1 Tax=Pseudoalteromonas holothuriae TaxID=2963714 RepID=A0A9W4QRK8_9GAMM|nr:hypothetical protein [Pseudoalteromonas sp. CIP111854]CAH9049993.1 hypothetical protein PSECIP111854_00443 [Pseudoalteromonas sp. CIP111854]
MNDLFYRVSLFLIAYEFVIVLWFIFTQFPAHRWSLFYANGKSLSSLRLHEMHSCFITAKCFFIFHIIGAELEQLFLGPLLSEIDSKIKAFYLVGMINQFLFLLVLFCIHRVRGCFFSIPARICLHTTIIVMGLIMMQLIARGYFDYHELGVLYSTVFWTCNFICIAAISIYPIRHTLAYFTKAKQI